MTTAEPAEQAEHDVPDLSWLVAARGMIYADYLDVEQAMARGRIEE